MLFDQAPVMPNDLYVCWSAAFVAKFFKNMNGPPAERRFSFARNSKIAPKRVCEKCQGGGGMRNPARDNDLGCAAPASFDARQDFCETIENRAGRRAKNLGGRRRLGHAENSAAEFFRPRRRAFRHPEGQDD